MPSPIVMVVDDEPALRELISDVLSWQGYDVRTAANGLDALCQLRRGGPLPDVILLDITMPVMDGITFRLAQLEDPELRPIPVVVASALVPLEELPTTRQIGKPFGIEELLHEVTRALGRTPELELRSAA